MNHRRVTFSMEHPVMKGIALMMYTSENDFSRCCRIVDLTSCFESCTPTDLESDVCNLQYLGMLSQLTFLFYRLRVDGCTVAEGKILGVTIYLLGEVTPTINLFHKAPTDKYEELQLYYALITQPTESSQYLVLWQVDKSRHRLEWHDYY